MTAALAELVCTPCRGGVPPLDLAQAEQALTQVPAWALRDDARRIERRYWFANFADAFAFTARVAELAEAQGHHPDVTFGWGYAVVSLQTKKIRGLHENDFIMAAKADRIAEECGTRTRTS